MHGKEKSMTLVLKEIAAFPSFLMFDSFSILRNGSWFQCDATHISFFKKNTSSYYNWTSSPTCPLPNKLLYSLSLCDIFLNFTSYHLPQYLVEKEVYPSYHKTEKAVIFILLLIFRWDSHGS